MATPTVRQRLRLARTLAGFGSQEWEAPSRCAGWTNRNVVVHLASASRFWAYSISQARRGAPYRVLADFDPVAAPAGLVAAAEKPPPAQVLDAYLTSAHTLVDLLGSLTSGEWTIPGESPLGHVSISAIVRHALWDAWVHERDITLGVGLVPAVEADQVDAALRCAAALGPAFGILLGDLGDQRRAATVTTQDPAIEFTVAGGPGSPGHRGHSTRQSPSPSTAAPSTYSRGSACEPRSTSNPDGSG